MDRPAYTHRPVQTIGSLARALQVSECQLLGIAQRATDLYIGPKPKPKKNGGIRYVFDTKPPLKSLLRRINSTFFKHTHFPKYLTGSLSGRDFVANVEIHKGARNAVTEDIAQFFDCISADHVYRIWRDFFRFGDEVASLLTKLTTKDGHVFQGTPTSSYLANLAFWDREFALVEKLKARGIRYSRYVDDITISTTSILAEEDKRWAIGQVYGMIGAAGFKPQRSKHGSFSASHAIRIMGLNANRSPTLTKQERSAIRAQVYQLEHRVAQAEKGLDIRTALSAAIGKVGRLKRLHPREGAALRLRLDAVRCTLDGIPLITHPAVPVEPIHEAGVSPF
ncbi:RNA-directed DNA polymerase [Burkholderia contaminans]|uniref:RNA-directed DNA polymerase n=1 Tax=Burkholderia contaminans TaxID=488447 RepID=A0A3N8PAU5_9BURK|nr:reverse transcriptase family protein [Burkholderia contaminans]ELK6464718.1 RNA-directed DNA polymerase [Burkholderia contaminans]RQT08445.1 RNA-directed DNA polymerase [Burkholderia contaminans]